MEIIHKYNSDDGVLLKKQLAIEQHFFTYTKENVNVVANLT